jgi:WD40 repeat protein
LSYIIERLINLTTYLHTGICKLRGHKDAVTGLGFVERNSQKLLVSVSKDTLLKVWDVATQHCIQTIVGHRCEIYSLVIHYSEHAKDNNGKLCMFECFL